MCRACNTAGWDEADSFDAVTYYTVKMGLMDSLTYDDVEEAKKVAIDSVFRPLDSSSVIKHEKCARCDREFENAEECIVEYCWDEDEKKAVVA